MKKLLTAALITSTLLFSSCYNWWEDKPVIDTNTPEITLEGFLYEDVIRTYLVPPSQLIASQGMYSNAVKISWNEVEHASSYRIERAVIIPDSNGVYAEPEETNFEVIEKYYYKTSYEDIILSNPGNNNDEYSYRYYYRVCAENIKLGLESSDFTDFTQDETKGLGWLLPPPTDLQAWKGKSLDEIKLTWNPVKNTKNYILYRGRNENGIGMEQIASIPSSKTTYTNIINDSEKGIEFYYTVVAELASGALSAKSSIALGYSLKPGAPTPPSEITIADGLGVTGKSVEINWSEVPAPATGGNLTYSLYYTTSADSVYTLIRANIPRTTTSYVFDKLKPGLKYYFYVQSIIEETDGSTNKSSFSETGPTLEDGSENENQLVAFILSPPSDIELQDSSDPSKIIIRWTPAIGYDIIQKNGGKFLYTIYYDETSLDSSKDGTFTDTVAENLDSLDEAVLKLGEDGYYQVEVAKHTYYAMTTTKDDLVSAKSSAIAPTPSAPTNVMVTKNSGLDGLEKYTPNTNGVYPVKITWSAPSGENPNGYHIYRATAADGSFKKITDEPITDGSFQFIDANETARAGNYYYYKVVSLNVLGQGKKGNEQSNNSKGYGSITREQWFREYNKTIMSSQAKLTLMHKSGNTDKLGKETINGDISGTLYYDAAVSGVSGVVTMLYTDYADTYIKNDETEGVYFCLNGNTNTKAGMDTNGNMYGTTTATGMYPGKAVYDNLEIKKGAAGGGYYLVTTYTDNNLSNPLLAEAIVDWTVGEGK